jgi:hypothetical protein
MAREEIAGLLEGSREGRSLQDHSQGVTDPKDFIEVAPAVIPVGGMASGSLGASVAGPREARGTCLARTLS